jgi:hypothetical protein
MEEGQERDSSSDEQRHIIDDDDMEDDSVGTFDCATEEKTFQRSCEGW